MMWPPRISLLLSLALPSTQSFIRNHASSQNLFRRDVVAIGLKKKISSTSRDFDDDDNASVPANIDHNSSISSTRRKLFQSAIIASAPILSQMNSFPVMASDTMMELQDTTTTAVNSSALCDPAVSQFIRDGRIITILGTAHISGESAKLAGNLVREMKPEAVFVELDNKRVKMGAKGNEEVTDQIRSQADDLRVGTTVRTESSDGGKSSLSFFDFKGRATQAGAETIGKAIGGMYRKLESEGFEAGDEFATAIKEGLKYGATVVLGDRDIDVTLRRLAQAVTKTDIFKLLTSNQLDAEFTASLPADIRDKLITGDELTPQQLSSFVETMKTKETVKMLMKQVKQLAPEIYMALVGERDEYMANGLDKMANMKTTVAIVGMAHIDGIETKLQANGWKQVPSKCPLGQV